LLNNEIHTRLTIDKPSRKNVKEMPKRKRIIFFGVFKYVLNSSMILAMTVSIIEN
jgi:hypothetical protein